MAKVKSLKALIEEASSISDETYNSKDWVTWFNNGLDDLSDILYFDKEVEIPNTLGKFSLPENLKTVISISAGGIDDLSFLNYEDNTSIGYKIIEDMLSLQGLEADSIKLYYYRLPNYISTLSSDVPVDLPDSYTRAIIYWASAQAMIKEDEPDRYDLFMDRYGQAKSLIYKAAKNKGKARAGSWKLVR